MRVVVFLMSLLLSLPLYADAQLTLKQKTDDIEQLVSLLRSSYGPRDYKEGLGISIEDLRKKYLSQLEGTHNGEFYYLILRMVAELRDSHFSAAIPTSHSATLGFTTDLVEDRVLIEQINRNLLPEAVFDFQKGDEVISIDGEPMASLLQRLSSYRGMGYAGTSRRLSAMLVSSRPGRTVPVPTGEATVSIGRGTSDIIETVVLRWQEQGESLDEMIPATSKAFSLGTQKTFNPSDFQLSIREALQEIMPNFERSYACSGRTRVAIPEGATILMTNPFVAYYHATPKGNVGYLRIPHYYPQDAQGEPAFEERFAQYEWAVEQLEAHTAGLILDQDHNCGGSVDYLERMAGLFLREAFAPLQFEFLASKPEYLKFRGWLNELPRHTLERENFSETVDLLKKHWLLGDFLTPRISFFGLAKRKPQPYGYTKPIVMLIDEMSGSGGDAFPALLQGNGRAKLLGTRTMGAGGHVEEAPPLNNSGISLWLTKSLFYRPNGIAIENNGAMPDIPYTMTRDDFLYKYRNYQKFYLEKLLEIIP